MLVGEYGDGFEKYNYNQEGIGEALFTDEGAIPISDDDYSRLVQLAESIGVTPDQMLAFVLRNGFDATEHVTAEAKRALQEKPGLYSEKVMAPMQRDAHHE